MSNLIVKKIKFKTVMHTSIITTGDFLQFSSAIVKVFISGGQLGTSL